MTEFEQVNTDGVGFYTTKGRSKGQHLLQVIQVTGLSLAAQDIARTYG